MDWLSQLESDSIYVIREAYHRFSRLAALWSCGKDSTALLWLCRKAFLGHIPFPVIHIDTSYKSSEIYAFRTRLQREWNLDLHVCRNVTALDRGVGPRTHGALSCCQTLKTEPLKQAVAKLKLDAVLVGIRRDEHGVRAKERYFSGRAADFTWPAGMQPAEAWDLYPSGPGRAGNHTAPGAHRRIHPLLHATELDVWRYTAREALPVNPLYFSRDGQRYRSIGCAPCCRPVASTAADVADIVTELAQVDGDERQGREQDKELRMQQLRALGYM